MPKLDRSIGWEKDNGEESQTEEEGEEEMTGWIWRRFFARLDAHITNRIVQFHQAMMEIKQIPPSPHAYGDVSRSD